MRFAAWLRTLSVAIAVCSAPPAALGGAPFDGEKFYNPSGPRYRPSFLRMFPFFARRAWASIVGRPGAASWVAYDPDALMHNASLTWIGHSTMLVRMDGVTFLTDPIFSDRCSPLSFAGPKRYQPPGVPLDELPAIDFVVLSHDHYDHADWRSIEALAARGVPFITPLGLGRLVREAGGEVTELDWWQSRAVGGVTVHCVPAQHFSGRGLTDENETLWSGWVIEGPTRRFFHAGDTGYFDGFTQIRERLGPIDLAALPIGAYDPPWIMQPVHLNPEEAIQAALDLHSERVVAMHYGTFDLTDEPMDEAPRRFRTAADRAGLGEARVWTLDVGESRVW